MSSSKRAKREGNDGNTDETQSEDEAPATRNGAVSRVSVEKARKAGSKRSAAEISNDSGTAAFSRAGTVKAVRLTNIRNHKQLNIELGSGATFIIGDNGSGKSSIAIGIQLGLGCKVGKPAPGSWGHVREHSNGEAIVELDLCNVDSTDNPAYRPDVYGDTITIRRRIVYHQDSGTCTDRTETHGVHGLVVKGSADAKREVEQMCASFHVAWDNVVMIMDQETSKSFLTGEPEKQYDFFMTAMGLKGQFHALADLQRDITFGETTLAARKSALAETEHQLALAKVHYNKVKGLKDIQAKVDRMDNAELWAQVEEQDKAAAGYAEEESALQNRVEKGAQIVHKAEVKLAVAKDKEAAERAKLDEMEAEQQARKRLIEDASNKVTAALVPLGKLTAAIKTLKAGVDKARKGVAVKEGALAQVKAGIANRKGTGTVSKAAATEEAEAAYENADREAAEGQRLVDEATEAVTVADAELREVRRDMSEANSALSAASDEVSYLEKATQKDLDDPLSGYRRIRNKVTDGALRVHGIIAANAGSFRTGIIGPLASTIRISDPSWARAVESQLQGLHNFIVRDGADGAQLERLCRQANANSGLSYASRPDTKAFEVIPSPAPGIRTMADILTFEHWIVRNVLIDTAKLDQTFILEDPASVNIPALLTSNPGYKAIDKDCFKYKVDYNGQITQQALNDKLPGPFIRGPKAADHKDALAQSRGRQTQAKKRADEARVGLMAAEAKLHDAQKKLQMENAGLASKKRNLTAAQQARKTALALPDDKDDDEQDQEDQAAINSAQDDIDSAKADVETAQAKLRAAEERFGPIRAAVQAAEAELAEAKASGDDEALQARLDAVEAAATAVEVAAHTLSTVSDMQQGAQAQLSEVTAKRQAALDVRAQVHVAATSASGWSEQDSEFKGMSIKDLRVMKRKFQDELKAQEKSFGGEGAFARAAEEFRRASKSHGDALKELEAVEGNLQELHVQLTHGKTVFKLKQEEYASNVVTRFSERAGHRGHNAAIKFEHGKRRDGSTAADLSHGVVNVRMVPDAASRGTQHINPLKDGSEAGALSGGEKSFASNILLSAIARVAEPPFRLVDEFDVFQDEPSRKASMQYLLDDATSTPGYAAPQFILLTPHDITSGLDSVHAKALRTSGRLKVLRLAKPKREEDEG